MTNREFTKRDVVLLHTTLARIKHYIVWERPERELTDDAFTEYNDVIDATDLIESGDSHEQALLALGRDFQTVLNSDSKTPP